jgi:hypothetical protein
VADPKEVTLFMTIAALVGAIVWNLVRHDQQALVSGKVTDALPMALHRIRECGRPDGRAGKRAERYGRSGATRWTELRRRTVAMQTLCPVRQQP